MSIHWEKDIPDVDGKSGWLKVMRATNVSSSSNAKLQQTAISDPQ